ncbi:very short patch repair endonuclease [Chryseobacterium sp. KMC2]|uniref:very short patch repair endonuclease n=1 Tax=Chryseobacterium sp. KMC2 TaxID=2800705 RepID=UPI0019241166|nr:very short patch repair endonuclease [Chryseobacterium sp. KMC2]MBL3548826.1 very short patch repair endonuclease [Chryseobacterium sp. KMC2]
MDNLTPEQRRKNMIAIKGTATKAEILLAKQLFSKGYRYRKNNKSVFGKPDLTFKKIKLAIFVDGEFWHGKDWETRKENIKSNREYWIPKIEKNISRDQIVNAELKKEGWTVLRFWAKDIEKNTELYSVQIEQKIKKLQIIKI